MSQASFTVCMIAAAFVLFIAARGSLPKYLATMGI